MGRGDRAIVAPLLLSLLATGCCGGGGAGADLYVVRRGDTIYGLQQRLGVTMGQIVRLNEIDSMRLVEGETLRLPRGTLARAGTSARMAPETPPEDPMPPPPSFPARPAGTGPCWPVRGNVRTRFGTPHGDLPFPGIQIGAPEGAPVVAWRSGTVVAADTDLFGLGQTVIVDHGDTQSLYAHLSAVQVRVGQAVSAGEALGAAGSSGRTEAPGIRFCVYRNGEPVDPEPLLRGAR